MHSATPQTEPSVPMGFVPNEAQPVAKRLVASYPPQQREQVAKEMSDLLARYREIEARFGLAPNDVAGAVAAFVAGNYMAWRDVEFPDAAFAPLVQQMRGVIAAQPRFRDATDAEKQQLYEEMAVVGMHMALQLLARGQVAPRQLPADGLQPAVDPPQRPHAAVATWNTQLPPSGSSSPRQP